MPPRHLPILDGLRAIAVLMVLWEHVPRSAPGYPEWLQIIAFFIGPGGFGVDLFFVLSGFLITRILLAERELGMPLRWFLLRRALRIFPIYYLLLLIMLVWRPATEVAWCALYLSNLREILWPESGPLSHTWSLCVEEHFYLLWPPVVAFLPLRVTHRVLVFGVLPAAAVGAWIVCESVDEVRAIVTVQRGSPFRFFSLGAGCLLAFHERTLLSAPRRAVTMALALIAVSVALHPYLLFVRPLLQQQVPWLPLHYGPLAWLVQTSSLSAGLVLLAVIASQRFPRNLLTARPLRAIGRISYGIYLYHQPIFVALFGATPTVPSVLLALALTLLAAAVSYWMIEAPILRRAGRFRAWPAAPPPS